MLYQRYRYSQWDGTQQIFDVDASEVMDALSDDLLQHGDLARALRDLFRNGMQNRDGAQMPNLRQLMEQLKQQRRQQLQQSNLDSVVDDLKERMDEILRTERQGIQRRLDEAADQPEPADMEGKEQQRALNRLLQERAQRNLDKLDGLPDSLGGQIQELMDYDFMDPDAQQMFQELLDMLKGQMAQNVSQQMQEQMQNMTPEQMEAMRQMMQDLNQMLRDRMEGRDPNFEGFMQKWGPMFGDDPPRSLDELMERIQQQMAQMQSLMDSLSPDMRRELEDAMQSAMDPRLMDEMSEFASLMQSLMPPDELARQYPFLGDDSMTLEQAMEAMRQMQDLDRLEQSLQQAMRTGNLDDVDPEQLAELLGEEARRAWEELDRLRQMLKDAGYITDDDQLNLTARGIRRIGQKAMREVFQQLKKDRIGNHDLDTRGAGGDLLGDTKTYEFGDPLAAGPANHGEKRHRPGRAAGAGQAAPGRLRDLPQRAHDPLRHHRAAGPEPFHGPVQQLGGGEKGHSGVVRSHPPAVPPGHAARRRVLRLRPRAGGRGSGRPHLEQLGVRHQSAPRPDAVPQAPFPRKGWHPPDTGHHRRRAHRSPGRRAGLLRLPAQLPHRAGNPERGAPLHPGRHRHQHVHAGEQLPVGQLRRPDDAHQPGTGLLQQQRKPGRVRAGRLHHQPAQAGFRLITPLSRQSRRLRLRSFVC